ncbi:hypothetical protein B0H13DRAFT_1910033 [Mycena leptocephala]|nr:hypothetical protein B0H13DRAFT_1910033 [Mycena leptocephala]
MRKGLFLNGAWNSSYYLPGYHDELTTKAAQRLFIRGYSGLTDTEKMDIPLEALGELGALRWRTKFPNWDAEGLLFVLMRLRLIPMAKARVLADHGSAREPVRRLRKREAHNAAFFQHQLQCLVLVLLQAGTPYLYQTGSSPGSQSTYSRALRKPENVLATAHVLDWIGRVALPKSYPERQFCCTPVPENGLVLCWTPTDL